MPSRDAFVKFWWQSPTPLHTTMCAALCAIAKKAGSEMIAFETVWLL
ncbi:hypothetical protein [Azospirillum palustre]